MPSLKYYDPTALAYKYLVGGLSQETADARYLVSGFRNVIRNGDMSIAQRGNGPWATPNGCYIDGFSAVINTGTGTVSRVVPAPGTGSSLLQFAVSGQSVAGAYAYIGHPMEDVSTLAGKQVTLSFDAFASSGTPKIGLEIDQAFGSGGSANVYLQIGAVTLSTTRTRYSMTFTMPSIVGKTVGSGSRVALYFWLSAGSDFASRSSNIGIQSNTFNITDVQLEAGPVATPFERLPVQQQLAWCQRYFQRWQQPPLRGITDTMDNSKAGRMGCSIPTMRTTPTQVLTGSLSLWDGTAVVTSSSVFASYLANPSVLELTLIVTPNPSIPRPLSVIQSGSGYIDLSAEL